MYYAKPDNLKERSDTVKAVASRSCDTFRFDHFDSLYSQRQAFGFGGVTEMDEEHSMTKIQGPNFFIIGAAKAGTTSLSSLLNSHPDAGIVCGKEPHFFSDDSYYYSGRSSYLQLFNHCQDKKVRGDASTSYSRIRYHSKTIERIYENVPDAKIIYMVRHPLKRMESAYIEHLCTPGGHLFYSINEAVKCLPMIVDSSRYGEVLEAYEWKFDASNIKIVWFEEYVADIVAVFQDVCRFLGVSDTVRPDLSHESKNSRQEAEKRMAKIGRPDIKISTVWDEQTRKWVINQIRDDNYRFLKKMGRQLDYWGDLS